MPPYLRRVPPEVLVIILYFTSIGVDVETSSEIIRLKHRGYELSPQECQQRIDFTRGEYFPKVSLPWTLEGIAQEIPKHVTRDTFLSLAETDGDCEKLFSKVSPHAGNNSFADADCCN